MKTEKEILEKFTKAKKDYDKYGREPARIDINAPRACMQIHMAAEESLLKWILDIK